ncbi:unnamed protein product [Musa acuminata var. zebrina]
MLGFHHERKKKDALVTFDEEGSTGIMKSYICLDFIMRRRRRMST